MKRSLLPLNALRVFDAAARTLSFTRAADELAVTPAAVGQQIRALEETLGVTLFRRTTRGLELTPEAVSALPHLRAGFSAFEETVSRLREGQAATRLSIGCARGAIRHWLMPRLQPWLDQHGESAVQIVALEGPVDFTQGNLDLALSFGPAPDADGVFGRKLNDELLVTVIAPGGDTRKLGWRSLDRPMVMLPDAGQALAWTLAGLGIAQVPLTIARSAIESGLLVECDDRVAINEAYWLCAPEPQWKSIKVKAMVEHLLQFD